MWAKKLQGVCKERDFLQVSCKGTSQGEVARQSAGKLMRNGHHFLQGHFEVILQEAYRGTMSVACCFGESWDFLRDRKSNGDLMMPIILIPPHIDICILAKICENITISFGTHAVAKCC